MIRTCKVIGIQTTPHKDEKPIAAAMATTAMRKPMTPKAMRPDVLKAPWELLANGTRKCRTLS